MADDPSGRAPDEADPTPPSSSTPPPNAGQNWAPPPDYGQQQSYGQQYGYGQSQYNAYAAMAFWIQRMGTPEGPYNYADLAAQARSGNIRATTLVHRADTSDGSWFTAGDIPGIFSDKDWLTTLLISFFLGQLGIDRFLLGYTTLGVLKLITCGGCGLWWLIDVILVATGGMTDADGRPLRRT
jgi:hypothetical protein